MRKSQPKKTSAGGHQASHDSEQGTGRWDSAQVSRWVAVAVALLTFLVYGTALLNGFVNWDDDLYVYGNSHIRSLDRTFFAWACTDLSAGFWHPITWLSYAVDYALWGMNPLGYHLTAIILHALNTALVVALVIRLLDQSRGGEPVSWLRPFPEGRGVIVVAGVTGLLFGLHPLHVESVAWVSERKDLLCALFFLLSAFFYTDYVCRADGRPERPFWRTGTYLLSLGMFVLALASKTMAVSLPVVLLILDRFLFGRIKTKKDLLAMFVEKIPFITASLIISIVSISAQNSIGAMPMMASTSLDQRLLVACRSIAAYVVKMIVPLDLRPFYPYPKDVALLSPLYSASILFFLGVSVACFFGGSIRRALMPIWCYYLITLLPVLGIVQVGSYAMADRFTYLPGLGPFLLAGLAVAWGWERAGSSSTVKKTITVVVVGLVMVLSFLTHKQIAVWKSSIDLWNYVIERDPRNMPSAYLNRGVAFGDRNEFSHAIADFTTAISLDPRYADAYLNRGMAYVAGGDLDSAVKDYDAAITVKPDFADAYTNRGSVFLRKKEFDRAIVDYNRAIALQPGHSAAYLNRALAHKGKGEIDHAIHDYDTVLRYNPDLVNAYLGRGELHMNKGAIERAVADYQKACTLGSDIGCSKALFPLPL